MPNESSSNLPSQVTSFIGRERELHELRRLLTSTRLLTLTGAGGCGKTRLALQVAARVLDDYPDGVWLVELASLADPALVPQAVGGTFKLHQLTGIDVVEELADFLRQKQLCLLLDNCEHVVEAVASLVDQILRACPDVRVLATSREALGTAGELVWRVPSLSVPPPSATGSPDPETLNEYEATRLFIERARAVHSDFAPDQESAAALVEVCRRLDGIPLAIELAAARISVFSVEQIAARLDDRFRFLTAGQRTALPRQQTLQATVDWSYILLSEPERTLLRRLSVFAGGWSYEAAEAVAAGEGIEAYALVDLLAQLVDKSLVQAEQHRGAVRYRLLETIRQYALAKLIEAGEESRVRERHLDYFLTFAETAESKLRGPDERRVLEQLEEDHDNLRAALQWSLSTERDDEAALRAGAAMAWFWYLRGYQEEGLGWLSRALEARPEASPSRMKALYGAGWLAHHRQDSETARRFLQESLGMARELDDSGSIAWVLQVLGRVAYFDNDPDSARALGEESLAVAEDAGDAWLIAYALHLLGLAAYIAADYPSAWQHYTRSLAIRRELGYEEGAGILLTLMGLVALQEGDFERALELYREALAVIRDMVGPWGVSTFLGCFAYIAAVARHHGRAARIASASAALLRAQHAPIIPVFEPFLKRALEIAKEGLGPTAYAAAEAEGLAMSLDAAIDEALAVQAPEVAASPAPGGKQAGVFGDLTPAETQVLHLLTTGATTREIAAQLVVSISTVDRHLTHIYEKLGVRNRAEAIAAALQHQAPE